MTSISRPPLLAITSLRFFAALMVVASHLSLLESSGSSLVAWVYTHVFHEGYVGVTFFFILSGFILSYSYGERAEAGRLGYADFMFTRIARIVPLHLLTLLIALPLGLFGVLKGVVPMAGFAISLPLNATLLQAYVPVQQLYFSLNAPSWSLSVEMFFYALFPVLISLRSQRLALLAVAVVLAKSAVCLFGGEEAVHFLLYVFPPLRLVDFVAGILLFRLYKQWRHPSVAWATVAQTLSVAALIAFLYFKEDVSQALRYDIYYIVPMSMLVLTFSWGHGLPAKLVSTRALVVLGEASFALYLVHQLVIRYGEAVRLKAHLTSAYACFGFAVVYVFLSVGLSAVLFFVFEMKAKRWTLDTLRCWWARRREGGKRLKKSMP